MTTKFWNWMWPRMVLDLRYYIHLTSGTHWSLAPRSPRPTGSINLVLADLPVDSSV